MMDRRTYLALAAGATAGCSTGWDVQEATPSDTWSVASADLLIQNGRVGVSLTVCNDADLSNGEPCLTAALLDAQATPVARRQVSFFVDDNECESHMAWFDDVTPAEAVDLMATATITQIGNCPGTRLDD